VTNGSDQSVVLAVALLALVATAATCLIRSELRVIAALMITHLALALPPLCGSCTMPG
jgi:hypothetical protein